MGVRSPGLIVCEGGGWEMLGDPTSRPLTSSLIRFSARLEEVTWSVVSNIANSAAKMLTSSIDS